MARKSTPFETARNFMDLSEQWERDTQQGNVEGRLRVSYDDLEDPCTDGDGFNYLDVWRQQKDAYIEALANYSRAKKDLSAVLDDVLRRKDLLPDGKDWIFEEHEDEASLIIKILKEPRKGRGRQKKEIEQVAIKGAGKANFAALGLKKKEEAVTDPQQRRRNVA